ncbi:hypothetical protein GCM10014719_26550 [Planomonospora parontospora subsp. antibiotica]|nr:hypothetical protein GCM10014719_26550 [Planomonospora parontospora subsp. antibiotica]GII15019.1 hypothetical protein Ppa05_17450 [Planomonospora parontospora subsp. antibiotica]
MLVEERSDELLVGGSGVAHTLTTYGGPDRFSHGHPSRPVTVRHDRPSRPVTVRPSSGTRHGHGHHDGGAAEAEGEGEGEDRGPARTAQSCSGTSDASAVIRSPPATGVTSVNFRPKGRSPIGTS